MKILINAANARVGGGQSYLYNLLGHLPVRNIHVTLLAPASFFDEFSLPGIERVHLPTWAAKPLLRPFWERFFLPAILKQGGFDLLFCPGGVVNTTPPPGCKVVTMFRNMLPFDDKQRKRYPYGYLRTRFWVLAGAMLRSMKQADLVIFISHHARSIIEARLADPLSSSVVIPHGIAEQFRRNLQHPLPRPARFSASYLLYVSYVDVYKSQLEVVRAFAQVHAAYPELRLLLVGPVQAFYGQMVEAEMEALGLTQHVEICGNLPYAELPAIYQNAEVNIFASTCENCPNILLESMAAGKPVACSNHQPMPEFTSDAVRYFDPTRPDSIAATLLELLQDSELRQELGNKAWQRAKDFAWPITAERTWAAIMALEDDV